MTKTFTFKKIPRLTGLAGVGDGTRRTVIKLNKRMVGTILHKEWDKAPDAASVRLVIVTPTSENLSGFKWVNLKQKWASEQEARDWLNDKAEVLLGLGLFQFEEGFET